MSAAAERTAPAGGGTRMLFLGDAALCDGFQLIGFETWADPGPEQLEQVLKELLENRRSAFVIVDTGLAERSGAMLERARREGGRILITQVPPLNDPDAFRCGIDAQIERLTDAGVRDGEE